MHHASQNCSVRVEAHMSEQHKLSNPQLTRKVRLLTVFWDSGFYFHFANLFFFLKMKDKVLASVTVISNWFDNYPTAKLVGLNLS